MPISRRLGRLNFDLFDAQFVTSNDSNSTTIVTVTWPMKVYNDDNNNNNNNNNKNDRDLRDVQSRNFKST